MNNKKIKKKFLNPLFQTGDFVYGDTLKRKIACFGYVFQTEF